MKSLRGKIAVVGMLVHLVASGAPPQAPPPKLTAEAWAPLGSGLYFTVDVDMHSVNVNLVDGGWQIFARLRTTYEPALNIKGKAGSYALSDTIAVCKEDALIISTSTLFTKKGEPIETIKLKTIPNPHAAGNFIAAYLDWLCNNGKKSSPPLNT